MPFPNSGRYRGVLLYYMSMYTHIPHILQRQCMQWLLHYTCIPSDLNTANFFPMDRIFSRVMGLTVPLANSPTSQNTVAYQNDCRWGGTKTTLARNRQLTNIGQNNVSCLYCCRCSTVNYHHSVPHQVRVQLPPVRTTSTHTWKNMQNTQWAKDICGLGLLSPMTTAPSFSHSPCTTVFTDNVTVTTTSASRQAEARSSQTDTLLPPMSAAQHLALPVLRPHTLIYIKSVSRCVCTFTCKWV